MLNSKKKGFTLIELLVVITILAIISVVAYTNFSGSTDKAKNSKKTADITAIETALQTFFQAKNYYPMPTQYNANSEVWGYSGVSASINNTLSLNKNGDKIDLLNSGSGGGIVYLSGGSYQIGAKGTFNNSLIGKEYLSQNLVDPAIADIKIGNDKYMKDYGIGEYVYGVYAKNNTTWDSTSLKGSAYNLAVTIKDEQKGFLVKITGNFDDKTCTNCPKSLIGSGSAGVNLVDGDFTSTGSATDPNDKIPYPISF